MAISVNKPSPGWLHISTAQKHVRSTGAETDRFVLCIQNHTQSNHLQQYTRITMPNKHNANKHNKHTINMRKWNHPILIQNQLQSKRYVYFTETKYWFAKQAIKQMLYTIYRRVWNTTFQSTFAKRSFRRLNDQIWSFRTKRRATYFLNDQS